MSSGSGTDSGDTSRDSPGGSSAGRSETIPRGAFSGGSADRRGGSSSATRLGLAFWATTPWLLGFAVPAMDAALASAGRRGAAVVVLMALGVWLLGSRGDRVRADSDRAGDGRVDARGAGGFSTGAASTSAASARSASSSANSPPEASTSEASTGAASTGADGSAWLAALVTAVAALVVVALPQTLLAPLGLGICGAAGLALLLR
jgi:hypothetical protein